MKQQVLGSDFLDSAIFSTQYFREYRASGDSTERVTGGKKNKCFVALTMTQSN